jgi:hypothetical protein
MKTRTNPILAKRALALSIALGMPLVACKKDDDKKDQAGAPDAAVAASASVTQAAVATDAGATRSAAEPAPKPTFHAFSGKVGKSPFWFGVEKRGDAVRALYVASTTTGFAGKMTDAGHFSAKETHVPKGEKGSTLTGEITPQGTLLATVTDPKTSKKTQLSSSGGDLLDEKNRDFKQEYTGSLGGRFIRMKLEKSGAKIAGIYRYSKSAQDIKLEGTADDKNGSFDLTESVGGKTTGKFSGVFVSRANILAEWSSPDGARTFPVKMEHGDGYPETVELVNGLTLFPQETMIEGKRCKADIVVPQIRGAKDAAKATALNALLAGGADKQKTCEGPDDPDMMDYEESAGYSLITQKKDRFVSISQGGWSFTGGAHGNGSSQCAVIDTKMLTRFRMEDSLTEAGRKKLGDLVTHALEKQLGVTKLTDSYFYEDHVEIGKDTNVCLSDKEIYVEFVPYEVAPYMAGPQSAAFPKADVRDLFEKNDVMDAAFAQ